MTDRRKTDRTKLFTTPNTPEHSGFHYSFVILICCCLMMGVNVGLTFSCAGIFYTPVCDDLRLAVGDFGLYMTAMYVASAVTLPLAGRLLSRHSARLIFTCASALNGISLACMGLMHTLWGFYLTGAFLGISIAFLLYMSYPTLISRWFHKRIGLMIGICCAASGLGGIIFNPIGAAVIEAWGWRAGYFVFGAIVLFLITPLLGVFLRDKPEDMGLLKYGEDNTETDASTAEEGITLREAICTPHFYAILIFAFIMMGCSTLNLFIPGYAEQAGLSLKEASFAASASMLGVMLGKLMLGYINDRNCMIGVSLCTLGGAAGIAMIIFSQAMMALILTGAFFFGWCYAGVTVQTAMLTRKVLGSKDYARIFSIISISLSAGGAFASGGWGLLADATSYTFSFSTGAILLIAAFLLGVYSLGVRGRRRFDDKKIATIR